MIRILIALVPVAEWMRTVPGLRTIGDWLHGELFARLVRIVLDRGNARQLEMVGESFRCAEAFEDVAETFDDVVGDPATFVLQRDSAAWRE